MEPSKDKSCETCTHSKGESLDKVNPFCWDCSGSISRVHWEPKAVSTPRRIAIGEDKTIASDVMAKQVGGAHYKTQGVLMQPWAIILAWGLGFHRGNVLKYLLRAPQKNGKEDIKKAIHYLEYVLENYDELKEKGLL